VYRKEIAADIGLGKNRETKIKDVNKREKNQTIEKKIQK